MCQSRYQLVIADASDGVVRVRDIEGVERDVSLLAFDGTPPSVGEWLVVHSGYALASVEPEEALAAMEDLNTGRLAIAGAASTDDEERR
jgi:hydrogenase maturation factor